MGDVSGKGLEVAAASAMVRFFVEARAWDSEHPAEVLAQANRILRMRLAARRLRHRLPRDRLRGPAALLQRGPPAAVPAAGRRRQRGAGGPRAAAGHRGGRPPRGARDRDRARRRPLRVDGRAARGAPRRAPSSATRGCRSCWPSSAARCRRRRSSSACSPRRRSGRRCSTTTSSCSRCGARRSSSCATSPPPARPRRRCSASTWRSCASGSGPGFVPEEAIFATDRVFEEERAAFVVLYARGRPVGCGGVRSLGPGAGRDQAHVRDGGRARAAVTAACCWRSSSGARPRRARSGCGCSPPRC